MSYLTLKANDAAIASTFTPNWATIGAGGMQYRAVGATEWTDAAKGTAIPVDTVGIELKADSIQTSNAGSFLMTGSISASGDVTSLTNGIGGDCALTEECYYHMFYYCDVLTTAPELPSTTLANYCYQQMFDSCTSLTAAPTLPATTLADYCYYKMFYNCPALTAAPALPATTLSQYCYNGMFSFCKALTTPPELPATTLAKCCYYQMFSDCSALAAAPELPATTLAEQCYQYMFQSCSSLTAPPELPATTLAIRCYSNMFYNCTSLTTMCELPATTLVDNCYQRMFYSCSSLIGYTTAEPGYTLIHNHPTTTAKSWNSYMYWKINAASTVPDSPSSGVNYYFKPTPPKPSIIGKRLECFGHDQHEIIP